MRSIIGRWVCRYGTLGLVLGCLTGFPAWAQDAGELDDDSEYARGIQAFAEGNYEQAADLWLADAYLGSSNSQFNIGVLYTEGKGLPQDRAEAIFWFEKAARQGHLEAQYNLGHLLLEEQGDIEKIRQGIDWWRQSAEGEFALAQYNYGRALFHGIGVEEDRLAARTWFERATKNGNKHAAEFVAAHADEFSVPARDPAVTEPVVVAAENTDSPDTEPVAEALPSAEFEYVGVKDEPAFMYARFNTLSPIIARIDARMLLRVIARKSDWILAAVPGGLPGWVLNDNVRIDKDLVEVLSERTLVHADPTEQSDNNDIGELERGARVLLLEVQGDWVRVQLPEVIPGWIENDAVRSVTGTTEEIAAIWQRQQIDRKVAALSDRQIKVAAITSDSPAKPATQQVDDLSTVATADPVLTEQEPIGLVLSSGNINPGSESSDQPVAQPEPVEPEVQSSETGTVATATAVPPPPRIIPSVETAAIESSGANPSAVPETITVAATSEAESNNVADTRVASAGTDAESTDTSETVAASAPAAEPETAPVEVSDSAENPSAAGEEDVVEEILASGTIGRAGSAAPEPEVPVEAPTQPETVVSQVSTPEPEPEPAPAPEPEPESPYFSLESGKTDVRAAPSNSATIVTSLPQGTLVDVVGFQGDFAEVSIPGGLPLWVSATELRQQGVEAVVEGSRVRAWPDAGDERGDRAMGLLPEGSILRILEQRDGWVRVAVPEWMTGWVRRDGMDRPDAVKGSSRVWQQQASALLAGYLNARTREVAPEAGIQNDSLAGSGIDNDNQWLFQETSRKYTLQLFSMQNVTSARSLFESLNRRGQFFSTMVKGNRWYFVLLGNFLTRESAEAVAATLPRWASDARVRSLDRLQVNRCKKRDELGADEAKGLDVLCR